MRGGEGCPIPPPVFEASDCFHEDLRFGWSISERFICPGNRFLDGFLGFVWGPAHGVSDLGGIQELGNFVAFEDAKQHSVSGAGNEIANVAVSGERRHG